MPTDDERPAGLIRTGHAALLRVQETRERVIAALSDAFANDALDVDEFERRVTRAHTLESTEEITALTTDLPAPPAALAPATVPLAPAAAGAAAAPQTVYAVFGGVDRRGSWTVPRHLRVVAVFGGAQLDLREARFPSGVVDLEVRAMLGGVQIIVPPGLSVEVSGTAILGGFEHLNRAPAHPDPEAPLLRIHGTAFMGGVGVETRLPGEDDRQARRRQRIAERRERRALRGEEREARHQQRALDRLRDER